MIRGTARRPSACTARSQRAQSSHLPDITPARHSPGGLFAFPISSPPDTPSGVHPPGRPLGGVFFDDPPMLLKTGQAADEMMALEGEQSLGGARCVVRSDPILPDGAKWLRSLYCEPEQRRTGAATRLMRQIIAQADATRVALVLHPLAGDADGDPDAPDTERLERWYRSLGFFTLQRSPLLLVRAPDVARVQKAGHG